MASVLCSLSCSFLISVGGGVLLNELLVAPPWLLKAEANAYTYIHTYMHAYMHTRTRPHTHACIHAYTRTYVHAYMRTYVHTDIRTYIMYCMYHIYAHVHVGIHESVINGEG